MKINIDLRRKNSSHRKHARTLITEKVDLETQLAEKESQITKVKELMKEESLDDAHVERLRLSFVSINCGASSEYVSLTIPSFNCACPAIQRGQGSGFLSEGSS